MDKNEEVLQYIKDYLVAAIDNRDDDAEVCQQILEYIEHAEYMYDNAEDGPNEQH